MKFKDESFNIDDLKKATSGIYNRFFKRGFDLFLAIILIITLIPIYIILSFIQLFTNGLPIFYRPYRGGLNNKPFRIFKFRTMVKNADIIGGGTTALNDTRITRFGNILRKTKLDETPQLVNIILGNMSFIGPRPELLQYVEKYNEVEKYILKVRPGITDYSSIEFINLDEIVGSGDADQIYENIILKKKNQLRLKYVKEVSFKTDCKIFFITIFKVLQKIVNILRSK